MSVIDQFEMIRSDGNVAEKIQFASQKALTSCMLTRMHIPFAIHRKMARHTKIFAIVIYLAFGLLRVNSCLSISTYRQCPQGQWCYVANDNNNNNDNNNTMTNADYGECRMLDQTPGSPCILDIHCDAICDLNQRRCAFPGYLGATCRATQPSKQCETQLICLSGFCQSMRFLNQACWGDWQCKTGFCNITCNTLSEQYPPQTHSSTQSTGSQTDPRDKWKIVFLIILSIGGCICCCSCLGNLAQQDPTPPISHPSPYTIQSSTHTISPVPTKCTSSDSCSTSDEPPPYEFASAITVV